MKTADKLSAYFIVAGVVMLLTLGVLNLLFPNYTSAQDTVPAWEYAALAYDGDTAFAYTDDLAFNNEINKIYDAMEPNTMTSIDVMNVLGERGWEYIDYQPGSPVVYMFRKPLR